MISQDFLQNSTERYLQSLIVEASGNVDEGFDPVAPFGDLGIDSFHVLKIIRRLEEDFGVLPKTLLFEYFNVRDLAAYFVNRHSQALSIKFATRLTGNGSNGAAHHEEERRISTSLPQLPVYSAASGGDRSEIPSDRPVRMLEKEAFADPEYADLLEGIFARYKSEGCVSRGTRKIAPNVFIGSERRGYVNYGRCKDLLLVYGYAGPEEYLPTLMAEVHEYCEAKQFQLNILSDQEFPIVAGRLLSATPFGVLQRISNLKSFTLEGGAMRRLRYQVSRFEKSGHCRSEEYRPGSDRDTDQKIASIIDRWCEKKTMVNPLVRDVKAEVLSGTLARGHRLFLTYLDDTLQNAILITELSPAENGYLMDCEFYPPDMPLGGLEFAITKIIHQLAAEGYDLLTLGGTYGCKLAASTNCDPEIDRMLDLLRDQGIFNDAGNLQFKNKFRPNNKTIFLARERRSGNPDNVIDLIMMIADPEKTQTSDEENHTTKGIRNSSTPPPEERLKQTNVLRSRGSDIDRPQIPQDEKRVLALERSGFNPLHIPHELVDFDLKTDSWAQLEMPSITAQTKYLHSRLQQSVDLDGSVRSLFPFSHFALTASGEEAEHFFFKAWHQRGVVVQNLLFPTTLFHQLDNGFTTKELPHSSVFDLQSTMVSKSDLDLDALHSVLTQEPGAIAFACIEVSDNASGGCPISLRHLKETKALLSSFAVPLVIEATRILENAAYVRAEDPSLRGKTLWEVAKQILSLADAAIGSLTKDFCVTKGGIIATNDGRLAGKLQELIREEGVAVDLIDRKKIALSFQQQNRIESKVLERMEAVRKIWCALKDSGVPVVHPCGGHCVLINVKEIAEFRHFESPVASFLAWLYRSTGIRAAAHSVGMQKQTTINELVRLAIPVGLTAEQADTLGGRFKAAFALKTNIPEVVSTNSNLRSFGAAYASNTLVKYHNVLADIKTSDESVRVEAGEYRGSALSAGVGTLQKVKRSVPGSSGNGAAIPGSTRIQDENSSASHGSRAGRVPELAIIGMAGRYPKAKNLTQLWENLAQGRDCVEDIPSDRYESRLQHGKAQRYRGGFLDDIDKFDSLFFNISPREAEMLDPQERLFLEVAWETIEDAGYYPESLTHKDGSRDVGVFVGAVWAMYQMLGVEEKQLGNAIVPNSFLWSIANRISYWFNFTGPSLAVDTACSSSLTALHLACEAIYAGDCSTALVGGVNLDLHQAKLDINRSGGALSPDGVCRSFGKGANGYVAGEGIGALLLKPLDQAIQDKDNIHGVIRGTAVNHGGRTSGYTVPNPKAHASLIVRALDRGNVNAQSIGYIEAHGTGTELGDPIEIAGLTNAFHRDDVAAQTCAIGSIKSNIGHLEAAAGVVSISKVLLQMKHRQLAPSLHSTDLNEFIDFENSPFYVVQNLKEWKPSESAGVVSPLRAGISSFGAGGSNAHVILESYELRPTTGEDTDPAQYIFPISARNENQLRERAERFLSFLEQDRVNLNDVAFTLQIGRASFDHRLAIIARTKQELLKHLDCYLQGTKSEDIVTGHAKSVDSITRLLSHEDREVFVRLASETRDPRKIAGLWAQGMLADWKANLFNADGVRISLPTYPFADRRHWAFDRSRSHLRPKEAWSLHPLVDSNESTFERQIFKKVFHAHEFFVYDHVVAGIPTLPGVAYLELARKAGEIAAGSRVKKIKNILWVSPIAVQDGKPKDVFIELKSVKGVVQFEVYSHDGGGKRLLHSQGNLVYAVGPEVVSESQYIDLPGIRSRCEKGIDGVDAYPLFRSFGLELGPSFQVLKQVYKNEVEILADLELPAFRVADMEAMALHPSLVDGSLQAGMAAQLGDKTGEMYVPYSIAEVEILHPLEVSCLSYVTRTNEDKKNKKKSRVIRTDVRIVDQTGKVLLKINESTGVPLRDVYSKTEQDAGEFRHLFYSYDWEKTSIFSDRSALSGLDTIVLFDTDDRLQHLYQRRLRDAGLDDSGVLLVMPGECFQATGNQCFTVSPESKEDLAGLFQSLEESAYTIQNICFAWSRGQLGRGDGDPSSFVSRGLSTFLSLCQTMIQQKLEAKVKLIYLYESRAGEVQPYNEAMAGFVNTFRLEHPRSFCKTLEVRQDAATESEVVDALLAELCPGPADAVSIRYEAQERYIRRLKALDSFDATIAGDSPLKQNGVYLITGGVGGLGLVFAEYLARNYRAKLFLTGRSNLSSEKAGKIEYLSNLGAEVRYLSADVSSYEGVVQVLNQTRSHFGRIDGVIHAAGVLRDSLIRNKTLDELKAVLAPKVHGAINLDEGTKNDCLDFFVTFSSLAAVTGNAGQCDYSFANHFMDSFARQRELMRKEGSRSGKTLSINWSLWAAGGMKVDEQTELYFRKSLGMRPLSVDAGLNAFEKGLASTLNQVAVVEGIQDKLEVAWGLREKPAVNLPAASGFLDQAGSAAASPAEISHLLSRLQNDLSQLVMTLLKIDASDMSTEEILLDLGFDSIGLTTFANAINEKFSVDVSPVLFFDYPSVGEIAKYLSTERESDIRQFYQSESVDPADDFRSANHPAVDLTPDSKIDLDTSFQFGEGPKIAVEKQTPSLTNGNGLSRDRRFLDMPIAIVGISGAMPESEDLQQFWENLRESKDLISVIPQDRWSWQDYDGDPFKEVNKSNSKWGGFMPEVDKFDAQFFGISAREAKAMDPQQRIFLEHVWKAIEDSGYKVSGLSGTRTGLFVGVATNDYINVMNSLQAPLDMYSAPGNSHSVLANRVSYLLNLRGPSAPIDTACSSSLIALHRAIESIHTGSCDMAIVGGIQVILSPAAYISFGMAGVLSNDGKCRTFDKQASGYARGEGCGAILIKPLSKAISEGNHIYAVIKATAENHGGRGATLTAPNSAAQSEVLIDAYEKAQVDPATVGYIECHGTGTSLGDPIEFQALSKAFAELYKRHNKTASEPPHCGLSCVKTNIGHLETAAGIASLLKVVLSMKHKQIPATLHFEKVNPYIHLAGTPFYIADRLTSWDALTDEDGSPVPRRAGISAFGFGGANAHVVLEEYLSPATSCLSSAPGPQLIVLSAKNEDRLNAYARSMLAYLRNNEGDLRDFAYTLQVGRDEMPERLAFVAIDRDDAIQKFDAFLLTGSRSEGCFRNNAKNVKLAAREQTEREARVTALIEKRSLLELADLWVQGARIDWDLIHESSGSKRISLPTYPFARQRHWISATTIARSETRNEVVDPEQTSATEHSGAPHAAATHRQWLHPSGQTELSTPDQRCHRSTFTAREFFSIDAEPRSNLQLSEKTVPDLVFLEMARAATETMSPGVSRSSMIELRDVVWGPMATVSDKCELTIDLVGNDKCKPFEIYSSESQSVTVHCQGYACISPRASSAPLDISQLTMRMQRGTIDRETTYSRLVGWNDRRPPASQVIRTIHLGDGQLLANLSLPDVETKSGDGSTSVELVLHQSLIAGVMDGCLALLNSSMTNDDSAPLISDCLIPYELKSIRVLSPPTRDTSAWIRFQDGIAAEEKTLRVDIDLINNSGEVSVKMRGFTLNLSLTENAEEQPTWLFVPEQTAGLERGSPSYLKINPTEKMQLFLKQEAALQLQRPIKSIPTDLNYFELGLSSLGIADLMSNLSRTLNEEISPGVLFEHRDIDSLASYLAIEYSTKVDGLNVLRKTNSPDLSDEPRQRRRRTLTRFTRSGYSPESSVLQAQESPQDPSARIDMEQILEKVTWQGMSHDDSYETVMF